MHRFARPAVVVAAWLCLATQSGCALIQQKQALVRVDRGQALLGKEDLEAALEEFRAAAELDPQLAVAHSRLGIIYQRMGEYEQAIRAFASAVRCNPFSFSDTLNLARLYHFTERLHDAIQAYLHACDLDPDDFDAQLNLGVCYQQMGDGQSAVERFENAVGIDSDRPHGFVNLGVALESQGKHYEAIQAYKNALERDNRQPLVLVNLARTYMEQDRLKIAHMTLEAALHIDQHLAPAHEALGYCLFRLAEYDRAENSYRNALMYDNKLPRSYAGLGSILALRYLEDKNRQPTRNQALEYWHRSLELDPDQPRIRKLIARYKPPTQDPQTVLLSNHQTDR